MNPSSRIALALWLAGGFACQGDGGGQGVPDGVLDHDGGGLPDDDSACDYTAAAEAFFAQDRVLQIAIDFDDPGAWADMLAHKMEKEFHSATVSIDGESLSQVGVRFKGNSSLMTSQDFNTKSFKIHFEEYVEGRRFRCQDRISLNNAFKDPSMMRERLGYELAGEFGIVGPRTAHAEVRVDGELHGVFTVVQQVDRRFLKDRYGTANNADDGNLYKLYSDYDLRYLGPDATPSDYGDSVAERGLVLKTNEDDPTMNGFDDVTELTRAIDDVLRDPNAESRAALEQILNIDGYLRYQAWTLAIANLDVYYTMQHNLYIYRHPGTGMFETIPWDLNEAFGGFPCRPTGPPNPGDPPPEESVFFVDLLRPCDAGRPLNLLTIRVPEYRARYCELLEEFVDVTGATGRLYDVDDQDQRIADLDALLGDARIRMDEEGVLSQPPGQYDHADYVTNQGHSSIWVDGAGGPGRPTAGPNLGYFNDRRLASLRDQIRDLCQ